MKFYYGLNSRGVAFFCVPKVFAIHARKRNLLDNCLKTDITVRFETSFLMRLDRTVSSGRLRERLENKGWVIMEEVFDEDDLSFFKGCLNESGEITQRGYNLVAFSMGYMERVANLYSNTDETGLGNYPQETPEWMQGGEDAD